MKLKYKSISWKDNEKGDIFETDYVDFEESAKDEFIVLDFFDGNNKHHLEISNDEINIKYGDQIIKMLLHQNFLIKYKTPVGEVDLDWYLKDVNMGTNEITFSYDILVKGQIFTSNIVSIVFRK
ncbi:hypothetical protein MSATCC14277_4990 [Metamycoplasma salivarium]|uniref:hypothetical protein n=1 Tax=Metamycoplasma salivarium TaxID=2124 RepID=UPI001F29A4E8|nr:hypothetical protein [Metamycoplasma salivarium]GIZ05917.1 hypothetical protein MSATCC14277_4990 [Metamycoplasma salivarium]GIZ06480.1 hypothetical protein MSATCC23557_4520 [Metamycoplasma salivarium]GIZ07254.1 hypothetical protein MSATCC33130_6080 [Metamycoplasma salivarium]